jgi:hypothetical protein
MSEKTERALNALQADAANPNPVDEVDHVLTILRILKKQVSSPVVRECLEAARSDIAYLTGPGTDNDDEDGADA